MINLQSMLLVTSLQSPSTKLKSIEIQKLHIQFMIQQCMSKDHKK